jgi:hypothetical protein
MNPKLLVVFFSVSLAAPSLTTGCSSDQSAAGLAGSPSTSGGNNVGGTNAGSGGAPSSGGTPVMVGGVGAGGSNAGSSSGGVSIGGSNAGGTTPGGSSSGGNGGSAGGSGQGCSGGNYLICEDFEGTEVGQIPSGWTRRGPADKVGVADDAAVSGKKSLRIGAIENGERRIAHPGALLGAAHWGRVRFKVQMPITDAFVHSTIVAAAGTGPTKGALEVRLFDTVKAATADSSWCSDAAKGKSNCFQFLYNVQPSNFAEFGKGGPYGWTFDAAWHCAEWHVDSTDQSYELFYDNERIDSVSFKNGAGKYDNSDIPTTFDEVRVGWNNYQKATNPGFSAWIDDVALDDQRIGCE